MAPPCQRLYYRYQCRDIGALASILAVCAMRPAFDHLKVRLEVSRASPLEPVKFWNLGITVPGRRRSREPKYSMGQLSVADAGNLGARRHHRVASAAFPHYRDLCWVL